MALRDFNARELLLVFIGSAITFLVIVTCTRFYFHEYRKGILLLVLAAALALYSFESARFFWQSSVCHASW
jgi:glucose-6-phosphate-specific signal transduction histidine kinase